MAQIPNLTPTTTLESTDETILRQNGIDKRIGLQAAIAGVASNTNLLSNHNFIDKSPDDSLPPPDASPRSYPPGFQIFSGVFANETTGITNLTYVNGRVSFTAGDFYLATPNTGAIERVTEFTASVADFDGKPRTRGVSFALVGDEYRVTVGVDALEDAGGNPTPLGSVKFEQGSVATGHSLFNPVNDNPYTMTLEEAKANPYAKEGDTKEISDRGHGKFEYVTGATTNPYDTFQHDTLALQLKLIDSTPINAAHYGITWAIGGAGPDVTDAMNYFLAKGTKSIVPTGDYAISSMITALRGCDVDFCGSNIYATIQDTEWAMLVQSFDASDRAQVHNFQLISVDVKSSPPAEANWKHGLCLGGSNGIASGIRIENFSGISLGLGKNSDYSTKLPATTSPFYWNIKSVNVASMYGVPIYIGVGANANTLDTVGVFAFNAYNVSPTRPPSCVYEIECHGLANTLAGTINLEGAPDTNKMRLGAGCSNLVSSGVIYMEHAVAWQEANAPQIQADSGSSGNRLRARYSGVQEFASNEGTANELIRLADASVNAKIENSPVSSKNLVTNSDFTGGFVAPWQTFSTGSVTPSLNVGGAFAFGDSYREDIVSGRPNILQRIDGNLINLAAILGLTITIKAHVKTDIVDDIRVKIGGIGGNKHTGDGAYQVISATGRISPTATSVNFQVIAETGGDIHTGFVEISDCVAIIGNTVITLI